MDLKYQTFPLPAGTEATRFTVAKMVELIRAGIKSPAVRQKAVQVIRASGARPYDQRAEVSALFSFVKSTFRFVQDPTLVELLHTPEKLLEVRAGDCDDFTVILASLLGAAGYETRVAIVGPARGIWSHTFPEVWLGGKWIVLDATATERANIEGAKKAGNYKTFALQGGTMLGSPLLGYLPGTADVLKRILSFGRDMTLNYGPSEQAALDSSQGQALYTAYIDYGLPPQGAAALAVADLLTKDKYADQKAWRKLLLTSPLLQAQRQYPNDVNMWPPGVLTITRDGRRVRISPAPPIDITTDTRGRDKPEPEPDFRMEQSLSSGTMWLLLGLGAFFILPKLLPSRGSR